MTENIHPLRIYIIIAILLLLIILPPLFRVLFPKATSTLIEDLPANTTLTCTKDYPIEDTKETVKIEYKDNKIHKTTLTYTTLEKDDTDITNVDGDILPSIEISYFESLNDINIKKEEKKTTITLTKDSIKKNQEDIDLEENYFNNNKIAQKIYFINRSFTCEETTP